MGYEQLGQMPKKPEMVQTALFDKEGNPIPPVKKEDAQSTVGVETSTRETLSAEEYEKVYDDTNEDEYEHSWMRIHNK